MFSTSLGYKMLLIFMGLGCIFALAGLWLIFRPKAEGSTAKIELFGLKFESSSAGVLVFLIGSAFLAVPLFVESNQSADVKRHPGPTDKIVQDGDAGGNTGNAVTPVPPEDTVIAFAEGGAVRLEGAEVEPNDSMAAANVIPIGASITGVREDDDTPDFYRIDVPEGTTGELYITLTGKWVTLQVFNGFGEMLSNNRILDRGSTTFRSKINGDGYVARVSGMDKFSPDYELIVAARSAN